MTRNKRNTRRGRAKRWRLWSPGIWLNRRQYTPAMVAVKADGRWYVSVCPTPHTHQHCYRNSRAAAMVAAEHLAGLK